ncbi:MAG TPA: hypothetical protein VEJ36_02905 [Nitrososphaerales archaeon]|nr:hypothetical protein [Nitrososphaerales archaeon]
MRSRKGTGEVVGSVTTLAITIALLAGASGLAAFSIGESARLAQESARLEQDDAGTLVSVLSVQTNSSGTFVLLFDYGWVSPPVRGVYVGGSPVSWSSHCPSDWIGSVCTVVIPAASGEITILVGGVSVVAAV